mmetsp:Transcript_16781/g.43098  ORF Transcript_16781/g.43098 Transcript_16781/m.43098 type:complete len:207 (+) Transcript_16781:424-1044(+)
MHWRLRARSAWTRQKKLTTRFWSRIRRCASLRSMAFQGRTSNGLSRRSATRASTRCSPTTRTTPPTANACSASRQDRAPSPCSLSAAPLGRSSRRRRAVALAGTRSSSPRGTSRPSQRCSSSRRTKSRTVRTRYASSSPTCNRTEMPSLKRSRMAVATSNQPQRRLTLRSHKLAGRVMLLTCYAALCSCTRVPCRKPKGIGQSCCI